MRYFQQHVSQRAPFSNTKITAARIFYVKAISLILSQHSFHEYTPYYSPLMDLYYIYSENLCNKNIANINLYFETTKRGRLRYCK
jgi:hypothetical protein